MKRLLEKSSKNIFGTKYSLVWFIILLLFQTLSLTDSASSDITGSFVSDFSQLPVETWKVLCNCAQVLPKTCKQTLILLSYLHLQLKICLIFKHKWKLHFCFVSFSRYTVEVIQCAQSDVLLQLNCEVQERTRETQNGVSEQEHVWWQAGCMWGTFANEKPLCPRWRLTLSDSGRQEVLAASPALFPSAASAKPQQNNPPPVTGRG